MTLPKPKPRKNMTRHTSMSDVDQRLKTLESDLEVNVSIPSHKIADTCCCFVSLQASNLLEVIFSVLEMHVSRVYVM